MYRLFVLALCIACSAPLISEELYPDNEVSKSIDSLRSEKVINLNDIEKGKVLTSEYGGYFVYIYRRTEEDIAYIDNYLEDYDFSVDELRWKSASESWQGSSISGPENYVLKSTQGKYQGLKYRSLNDSYFVVMGMDSQYKCNVKFIDNKLRKFIKAPKKAVFFHVCHGQMFDSAGREINKNGEFKREGKNLLIPPHMYDAGEELHLGGADFDGFIRNSKIDYEGLSSQDALWKACRFNDYEMVKEALDEGANPNMLLDRGNSLDSAIIWSSRQIVSLLLEKGAKPTAISKELIETMSRNDISDLIVSTSK